MKAIKQYFPVVLFIMLYKVVRNSRIPYVWKIWTNKLLKILKLLKNNPMRL